ncbi:MAG: Gfo/Idh/MocA family protein [Candidatus Geothermincolia bacterium]
MTRQEVKVAIIGCGQICEAHIGEIRRIPGVEIVSVCDLHRAVAEDTADRYRIPAWHVDYREMLERERPDVVHLTTPPATHLRIGSDAIAAGASLYVEKPFCINKDEALQLIEVARRNGRIACAGFSELMDAATERFEGFRKAGRLGTVTHLESYYGDSFQGAYARVITQNKAHWIHRLPGKMFQNVMPHALYHVTPFFPCDTEEVVSIVCASESGLLDEVRILVRAGDVTAAITYTSRVRPIMQFLRAYGERAIVEVDFTNHVFSLRETSALPGPIARARNPIALGKALVSEGVSNLKCAFNGKDRFFLGMGRLMATLYQSVREGSAEPPIAYEQVLRVTDLMDKIIAACVPQSAARGNERP